MEPSLSETSSVRFGRAGPERAGNEGEAEGVARLSMTRNVAIALLPVRGVNDRKLWVKERPVCWLRIGCSPDLRRLHRSREYWEGGYGWREPEVTPC